MITPAELRRTIDALDSVVASIRTSAAEQNIDPYRMRYPSGEHCLAGPLSALANAQVALAQLERDTPIHTPLAGPPNRSLSD